MGAPCKLVILSGWEPGLGRMYNDLYSYNDILQRERENAIPSSSAFMQNIQVQSQNENESKTKLRYNHNKQKIYRKSLDSEGI